MKKYSCADCPFKLPVRLSEQYIFNHLAGRDFACRDVIGLYPLMEGNLCQFLALDFDSHDKTVPFQWKSDILAVKKVCNEYSIPSYMEISRSGNGAHLWIFFSEKVPAKQARNLGTNLLKAAMKQNHSISFESFDRMFPNQDEMPKGGYGNLIALPLQGNSVKQGHSVFVNDDFMPFDDQWAYLSSVQKLKEKDLNRAVKELIAITGDFHVRRNEDDENKQVSSIVKSSFNGEPKKEIIKEDFSGTVQITLSNQIYIKKKGISEHALGIIRRTAVFLNPEYFKKLRMHLPLYNIPRYIDCSKETDSELILPRGNLAEITEMLKKADVDYKISDARESGDEVDVVFKSELYEEQKSALKALLKSDCGVLSAGTGFGKTVTAAALIAERKVNTIIIVQNHNLLEQWKKSIKEFLGITAGTIAGGKDKSTGIIDIAIVNSLTEKGSDEVRPRSYKYGMVIVDECHHVSAFTTENLINSFKAKYVYGLTAGQYHRLAPYIKISDEYKPASSLAEVRNHNRYDNYGKKYYYERKEIADTKSEKPTTYSPKLKKGEHININASDTTLLKTIPGIGSYYARQTMRYRNQLGGFVSKQQLLEIEDFPEEALQYIHIDKDNIQKLNVNKMSLSRLKRHPYINYYQARAITDYRRLHGEIKDIKELKLMKEFTEFDLNRIEPYIEY